MRYKNQINYIYNGTSQVVIDENLTFNTKRIILMGDYNTSNEKSDNRRASYKGKYGEDNINRKTKS